MSSSLNVASLVALTLAALLPAACGDDSSATGGGDEGGGDATTSTTDASTVTSTGAGMVSPACEGAAVVSFTTDVVPIFEAKCATSSCHTGCLPKASLDLRDMAAHAELVGE